MGASLSDVTNSDAHAWYQTERRHNVLRLVFGGDWITDEAAALDEHLRALAPVSGDVELDGAGIQRLDSTGAWLMLRTRRQLEGQGARVVRFAYPPVYAPLFGALQRPAPRSATRTHKRSFADFLEYVGRNTFEFFHQAYRLLGFLGRVTVEATE